MTVILLKHPANHGLGVDDPWRERAACRGMGAALFYPESSEDAAYEGARAVCATCAVRDDCLNEGLLNKEPDGMWGGQTPKERRRMRRRLARRKAA